MCRKRGEVPCQYTKGKRQWKTVTSRKPPRRLWPSWVAVPGSRNFTYGQDDKGRPYLRFLLCRELKSFMPDAKVVPNRCTVYYNVGADDYDMVFERFTAPRGVLDRKTFEWKNYPGKLVETSRHEGIYCDQLQEIFERDTNLILDFCRVRFCA